MPGPVNISIEWPDLDQLIAHVKQLPDAVAKAVETAQDDDLRDVASLLTDYPPEKPGQKYIRTGTLGLGWLEARVKTVKKGRLNFEKSISNAVSYSQEVQGSPGQTKEFRDRNWQTPDDALKETEGRAQARLDKAVQMALNSTLGK